MKDTKKEQLLNKAAALTKEKARTEGIAIGATIAHLNDPFIYTLKEIKGDVAVALIPTELSPTGKEIIKEFPLAEIFDYNFAFKTANKLFCDELSV